MFRISAVIVGFAGTLMVLQVDPENFSPAVILPVIGGFLYAIGAVITRRTCGGESTFCLLAGAMTMQGLMGLFGINEVAGPLAFVTRGPVWPMSGIEAVLAVQILGSILGVFALTKAYQLGEASYVAVFEYSVMIFGPAFALFWFGQTMVVSQMAGVALIMAAGAVIALRSRRG